MELIVKMKLNPKTDIEAKFDGKDLQEVIRSASVLLDFDGKCGLCDCEDIFIQTRITKDKGYKYTEYICRKCGAKRQWGAYKDGGFFLKNWQEKEEYKKDAAN